MRIGMGPLLHHAGPILNPQLILAALRPSYSLSFLCLYLLLIVILSHELR